MMPLIRKPTGVVSVMLAARRRQGDWKSLEGAILSHLGAVLARSMTGQQWVNTNNKEKFPLP